MASVNPEGMITDRSVRRFLKCVLEDEDKEEKDGVGKGGDEGEEDCEGEEEGGEVWEEGGKVEEEGGEGEKEEERESGEGGVEDDEGEEADNTNLSPEEHSKRMMWER